MKDLKYEQDRMMSRQTPETAPGILASFVPMWKEPHVTIPQLVKLWGISGSTLRKWFRNDPEVVLIVGPAGNVKFFIPWRVAERVYLEHRKRRKTTPKARVKNPKKQKPVLVMPDYGTGGGVSRGPSTRSRVLVMPNGRAASG